ncbi:MAG: ArnT family glycosyltransferase [Thermoanaerobaculia bacterium]
MLTQWSHQWQSLLESPSPLSPWQRRIVWIAFVIVVATRFYAIAPSLWDWDEVQFAAGVREFNVGRDHHPHPPGFPLYMLAAKIVRPFVASDFRACQTVIVLSSFLLFPLAFSLARELRFSFRTSVLGALLFVFFPNVWFYGGTAFSDIAGTAASIAAAWLLMRGCRDPRAYLAGAAMLGVAAGIRSQALLFGFAPLAIASWFQLRSSWRRVAGAALILGSIVAASYIGAALASDSIALYRGQLEHVRKWVRTVDSYLSPQREPLADLVDDYLAHAMPGGRLTFIVTGLAVFALLAATIRPRLGVWIAFATFAPFAVFAWLMLDPNSVHRYSTSYVFLWALLAAYAAEILSIPLRRWAPAAHVLLLAAITARFAYWTAPALQELRQTEAPTHAVMEWLRARVPPRGVVWVHGSLIPFAGYYLGDRDVRLARGLETLPRVSIAPNEFFVTEGALQGAEVTFRRGHKRLYDIARRRYFEASIARLANLWTFGEGWYDRESDGDREWIWMGRRAKVLLPGVSGRMVLQMTLNTAAGISTDAEVWLNDDRIGSFRCGDEPRHVAWTVTPRSAMPNELTIVSSHIINLKAAGISHDDRDLGLQLTSYSWQPAP